MTRIQPDTYENLVPQDEAYDLRRMDVDDAEFEDYTHAMSVLNDHLSSAGQPDLNEEVVKSYLRIKNLVNGQNERTQEGYAYELVHLSSKLGLTYKGEPIKV